MLIIKKSLIIITLILLVLDYHIAIHKLASRINDGHGFIYGSKVFLNYHRTKFLTVIDSSTVVRNTPNGSMLKRGDIILSINGKTIQAIKDSIAPLIPSSNKRYTDNILNSHIFRTMIWVGCELTIMRNQQVITFREPITKTPDPIFAMSASNPISSDIYYLNPGQLTMKEMHGILDSLNNYKGVIIDLRYGMSIEDSWFFESHFLNMQEFCYAMATNVDYSHLGAFYKEKFTIRYPDELWQERKAYTGKKVLLIDERVMSAEETCAMGYRINGFTLIGTPTAGADGQITTFPLPGNLTAYFSGLGWYYPDGEQMQRIGIIPDIEVCPTMEDIMAGRDEVLEAAIKYLNDNH